MYRNKGVDELHEKPTREINEDINILVSGSRRGAQGTHYQFLFVDKNKHWIGGSNWTHDPPSFQTLDPPGITPRPLGRARVSHIE